MASIFANYLNSNTNSLAFGNSLFSSGFGSSSSPFFGSSGYSFGDTSSGLFGNSSFYSNYGTFGSYGSGFWGYGNGSGTFSGGTTNTPSTPNVPTGPTIATKQVSEDAIATADILTFAVTDFEYESGDDVHSLQVAALPEHGTLKLNGTEVVFSQLILQSDFIGLTYTPDPDYNGTDTFSIKLSANGVTYDSSHSNVSIVVTPAADIPTIFEVPAVVVTEGMSDTTIGETLLGTFADIDGDTLASITITGVPPHGTLQYTTSTGVVVPVIAGMNIAAADATNLVYIAPTSGNVSTTTPMTIGYTVTDNTGDTSVAGALNLTLVDGNDAPEFGTPTAAELAENDITTAVTPAVAVDSADTSDSISYSIATSSTDGALFTIDANSGALKFRQQQDFENPSDSNGDGDYELTLIATDSGLPARTDTVDVTVTLTNVDDEAPVFTTVPTGTVSLASDEANTFVVTTLVATDSGAGTDGTSSGGPLAFSIQDGDSAGALEVTTAGEVRVSDSTEITADGAPASYTLTIKVEDAEKNASTTTVEIEIVDETDPIIAVPSDPVEVAETTSDGALVYTVEATDNFAVTSYAFTASVAASVTDNFEIDEANGRITYVGDFDAETSATVPSTVTVPVEVLDAAGNSETADIDFRLVDADDTDPEPITANTVITTASSDVVSPLSIDDSSQGALETTITEDADGNVVDFSFGDGEQDAASDDSVTYALTASAPAGFFIDEDTGVLSVDGTLDHESATTHTVTVLITDESNATAETAITINVDDVNEAPTISETGTLPIVSEGGTLTISPVELATLLNYSDPENNPVTAVDAVSTNATDAYGNNVGALSTGGSLVLNLSTASDFAGVLELDVQLTNDGSGSGSTVNETSNTATLNVEVLDLPDAPEIEINGSTANYTSSMAALPASAPTGGIKIAQLSVIDPDLNENFMDSSFEIEIVTTGITNGLSNSDFDIDDGWLEYVGAYSAPISSSAILPSFDIKVTVVDQYNYTDDIGVTLSYIA